MTWLIIRFIPSLTLAEQDMIANPYEATSDSYYFVENKLVMHNKAAYCYDPALPLP